MDATKHGSRAVQAWERSLIGRWTDRWTLPNMVPVQCKRKSDHWCMDEQTDGRYQTFYLPLQSTRKITFHKLIMSTSIPGGSTHCIDWQPFDSLTKQQKQKSLLELSDDFSSLSKQSFLPFFQHESTWRSLSLLVFWLLIIWHRSQYWSICSLIHSICRSRPVFFW